MTTSTSPATPRNARPGQRWLVPAALMLLGLALSGFFGLRALRSFRQLRYIEQQGLDRGTASVDAIQPWMTIRFIAVAYAVPEEYLYSALGVAFVRRNADHPIGRVQPEMTPPAPSDPSAPTPDNRAVMVERAKAAVLAWRADPLATGLHDLRPWMSLRYIANTTGIPLAEVFTRTGLAPRIHPDKPLDLVAKEEGHVGGPSALLQAVAEALGVGVGPP